MIISKINGGLGNQLFQYAIARSIALKNNDDFKLDINLFKTYKLHNGYRLDLFNIKNNIATKDDIVNLKGSNNILNKILKKLNIFYNKSYYKEKERTIFDKNVFNYQDVYLDGYWQNEKYFIDIRSFLLKDLTPIEPLSNIANNYLEDIIKNESISIHVRRGDYLNHPEIGILDLEYYKNAIKFISEQLKKPIFYIFSNDQQWCQDNFNFIENKVFINNTESEIDDLILMKNCKHNIIANSSFSWWAAWLNENDKKIILAPKKWMAINPNNYKWIPDSWIEV